VEDNNKIVFNEEYERVWIGFIWLKVGTSDRLF
jgi:hypothetical protein